MGTIYNYNEEVPNTVVAVVPVTATTLTFSASVHAQRVVVLNTAAAFTGTLPQATGTGNKYTIIIGVAATATASKIQVANGTDVMAGVMFCVTTTSSNAEAFATSATSDTLTFNGTTQGGIAGDRIEITDIKTGVFAVHYLCSATGTEATAFSAAVS